MKKRNKLLVIPIFGLLIILSFILELTIFNHNILLLSKNDRIVELINDYKISYDKKDTIIEMNINDKYVNKLNINYNTDKDIPYKIEYITDDYYNNDTSKEIINDKFDNEVNETIINFRSKVKNLKIIYETNDNLNINNIKIDNTLKINYYRIIFLFLILLLLCLLIKFYKNGFKTELLHRYFFIFGLIIGSLFIVLQPSSTYSSWDDQIHFQVVNTFFGGNLNWTIGEVSMIADSPVGRGGVNSIEEQTNQIKYINSNKESGYLTKDKKFITYNKIAYIPSVAGYHLSKMLKLPFDICFKMGKMMNLIVYLLIISYAIKISKVGKRIIAIIGFIPTSIFLATQYSYDPAVTSGIILASVMLLNWLVDKETKITFKDLLIFIIIILYGSLSKAVYIPIALLFIFIPSNRFKNKKQSLTVKIGVILIIIAVMTTFILPSVSGQLSGDERVGNTSVTEQLKTIVNNPIGYTKILKDTMITRFIEYHFSESALTSFSYLNKTSNTLYFIFLILFLFVAITDSTKYELKPIHRIFGLIIVIGIEVLIWTALYLSFTPVGLNTINGVQARYFIPLLFLLIISIRTNKIKNTITDKNYNMLLFSTIYIIFTFAIYNNILLPFCM